MATLKECRRCGGPVPRNTGYAVPRKDIKDANVVLEPDERSILVCDACYGIMIERKDEPHAGA